MCIRDSFENGIVRIKADKLVGTNIFLDTASVGATINIMIAATKAEGVTTIENAAKEPHIVDTANFLNMIGCNVKGAGTDVIRITGTPDLHGAEYMLSLIHIFDCRKRWQSYGLRLWYWSSNTNTC